MRFAVHDPGRTLLYADETVEPRLSEFLYCSGMRIESAQELGLVQRAPRAHLHEARRRRRILLTRDQRFLDHDAFPFEELRTTGIVVITGPTAGPLIGGVICALITTIGGSGAKALRGQKFELRGERLVRRAMIAGHLRTEILLAGSALLATTAVAENKAIAAAADSARR